MVGLEWYPCCRLKPATRIHTSSFLVSPPLNCVNWNENIHFVPDFSLGSKAV